MDPFSWKDRFEAQKETFEKQVGELVSQLFHFFHSEIHNSYREGWYDASQKMHSLLPSTSKTDLPDIEVEVGGRGKKVRVDRNTNFSTKDIGHDKLKGRLTTTITESLNIPLSSGGVLKKPPKQSEVKKPSKKTQVSSDEDNRTESDYSDGDFKSTDSEQKSNSTTKGKKRKIQKANTKKPKPDKSIQNEIENINEEEYNDYSDGGGSGVGGNDYSDLDETENVTTKEDKTQNPPEESLDNIPVDPECDCPRCKRATGAADESEPAPAPDQNTDAVDANGVADPSANSSKATSSLSTAGFDDPPQYAPLWDESNHRFTCTKSRCSRWFRTRCELTAHNAHRHAGPQSHPCTFPGCGRVFKHAYLRHRHESTRHLGKLPFKCPFGACDWAFRSQHLLSRHMLTHTGERPHACEWPGCDQRFTQACGLRKHMLTHSNARAIACMWPGCDRGFNEKSNMQKHYYKVHIKGPKPTGKGSRGPRGSYQKSGARLVDRSDPSVTTTNTTTTTNTEPETAVGSRDSTGVPVTTIVSAAPTFETINIEMISGDQHNSVIVPTTTTATATDYLHQISADPLAQYYQLMNHF